MLYHQWIRNGRRLTGDCQEQSAHEARGRMSGATDYSCCREMNITQKGLNSCLWSTYTAIAIQQICWLDQSSKSTSYIGWVNQETLIAFLLIRKVKISSWVSQTNTWRSAYVSNPELNIQQKELREEQWDTFLASRNIQCCDNYHIIQTDSGHQACTIIQLYMAIAALS